MLGQETYHQFDGYFLSIILLIPMADGNINLFTIYMIYMIYIYIYDLYDLYDIYAIYDIYMIYRS